MNAYRQKSSADAKAILESGISTLDALTSSLAGLPYKGNDALSNAESAFVTTLGGEGCEKSNDVVEATYKVARDAFAMGSDNIRTLERFVGLHIPQMGEFNEKYRGVMMLCSCVAISPNNLPPMY